MRPCGASAFASLVLLQHGHLRANATSHCAELGFTASCCARRRQLALPRRYHTFHICLGRSRRVGLLRVPWPCSTPAIATTPMARAPSYKQLCTAHTWVACVRTEAPRLLARAHIICMTWRGARHARKVCHHHAMVVARVVLAAAVVLPGKASAADQATCERLCNAATCNLLHEHTQVVLLC